MRKMSDGSAYTDDDDDDNSHKNFGGFTSTVCVNFSQDDLRLATIPGQEGVRIIIFFSFPPSSLLLFITTCFLSQRVKGNMLSRVNANFIPIGNSLSFRC